MTALAWAAKKDKQAETLRELIQAGANMNMPTKEVCVLHHKNV